MSHLWSLISGYKTYFICAATIVYDLAMWWNGSMDQHTAILAIGAALGGMAMRHGISQAQIAIGEAILEKVLTSAEQKSPPPSK